MCREARGSPKFEYVSRTALGPLSSRRLDVRLVRRVESSECRSVLRLRFGAVRVRCGIVASDRETIVYYATNERYNQ